MADNTKTCPFCAEEIALAAVKCKHCGEWLESPKDTALGAADRGSANARAVAKGIKTAQRHQATIGMVTAISFAVALCLGVVVWVNTFQPVAGWLAFFVIFGAPSVLVRVMLNRE